MQRVHRLRETLEQEEAARLAPYAVLSRDSHGRMHNEPESAQRTAFQRDRDRILHSAAFRRLEYKTQVFVNDEGDYYRTRLTHTLEVAQIGKTIARALGVNEDLVEAICLAHDLGHPPFGHAGESALDAMMAGEGGFNHNLQSYRVVTELENRYMAFRGLNLTLETLSGIVAHKATVDVARATGLTGAGQGSLEAQIADLSDELAYNAHDLDDGLSAELFSQAQLDDLAIWQVAVQRIEPIPVRWIGNRLDELARHAVIRELVGMLVTDVIDHTARTLEQMQPASASAIQQASAPLARHTDEMRRMNAELKAFLYRHMYGYFRIVRMQRRAERYVREMFAAFTHDPRQLPDECQHEIERKGLVCVIGDYIASMTDRSALLEYRRLYDPLMRP